MKMGQKKELESYRRQRKLHGKIGEIVLFRLGPTRQKARTIFTIHGTLAEPLTVVCVDSHFQAWSLVLSRILYVSSLGTVTLLQGRSLSALTVRHTHTLVISNSLFCPQGISSISCRLVRFCRRWLGVFHDHAECLGNAAHHPKAKGDGGRRQR